MSTVNSHEFLDFGIRDPCVTATDNKHYSGKYANNIGHLDTTYTKPATDLFSRLSLATKLTATMAAVANKVVGITPPQMNHNYEIAEGTALIANFADVADTTSPDITPINLDVAICEVKEEAPPDFCPECKLPLKILEDVMICSDCGLEVDLNAEYNPEVYNSMIDGNYNSSTTASTSFTFSGKKSYGYQKAILKSCSDYSTTSYQTIKKEILNRINMYEGNKPPMNIQLNCIDLYYSIKENNKSYLDIINQGATERTEKKRLVFRSNGKWGIIAACLYYSCVAEGLTRTPREISDIIGIDEKYQSAGDKRLQEFYELGIINIPIHGRLLDDYIGRYFPLLGIPDKYRQFVVDMIARAEQKCLHICNENRTSTKCVGVIYILCMRIPELRNITRDVIARECKISKTTFVRYSATLLNNWPLIKKIFKRHHVPMPIEWRK
jgi:hypothetical protein